MTSWTTAKVMERVTRTREPSCHSSLFHSSLLPAAVKNLQQLWKATSRKTYYSVSGRNTQSTMSSRPNYTSIFACASRDEDE